MQAVKIHVNEKLLTLMLLHNAECRRSNSPRNAESGGKALGKGSFTGPKITLQTYDIARL
jgi:hypothetical protein